MKKKLCFLLIFICQLQSTDRISKILGHLSPVSAETKGLSEKHPHSSVWDYISNGTNLKAHQMREFYVQDCINLQKNNSLPKRTRHDNIFRVATYNVHFFTSPTKKKNFNNIFNVIKSIDADLLVLQELLLFDTSVIKKLNDLGYKTVVYVPTQGRNFGNAILCKHSLIGKPIKQYYEYQTRNLRAFINVKLKLSNGKMLSVYGTHLDVYDETGASRSAQINELLTAISKDKTGNIIIAGDFNAVRKKDYLYKVNEKIVFDLLNKENIIRTGFPVSFEALETLEKAGFKDSFEVAKISAPKFTTWAGTRIDFQFLSKKWNLLIAGCYAYYSAESDHLPIVTDIKLR